MPKGDINLASNFSIASQRPLDDRTIVADITERDAIALISRYNLMVVYIDDGTNYVYQLVSGTVDTDLDNNANWVKSSIEDEPTHTGDVIGDTDLTIVTAAVTYSKMQEMSEQGILGRYAAGAGLVQEMPILPSNVMDNLRVWRLHQPDETNPFVYTDNAGALHIDGNIIQRGAAYETHAEQLYTTKDLIITRDGELKDAINIVAASEYKIEFVGTTDFTAIGAGGNTVGVAFIATGAGTGTGTARLFPVSLGMGEYTGIKAQRYDGSNDGVLVFDMDGVAKVGDVGSEQPLATREPTPTNNYYARWNSLLVRFDTIDLDAIFAALGGDAAQEFEVAPPLAPEQAMPRSFADDRYPRFKGTVTGLPSTTGTGYINFDNTGNYFSTTTLAGNVVWGITNIGVDKTIAIDVRTSTRTVRIVESGINVKGAVDASGYVQGLDTGSDASLISIWAIGPTRVWVTVITNA